MKIIFINRFFYPDHSATSQILSDLVFFLAERGDQVEVLTSRQRYDDPRANLPRQERINGVLVHRVFTTRFGRMNLLGRVMDFLSFYISAAIKLVLVTKRGDILVAKTDPPMISVVAALVARLKRAKLVNWLQDLFPEVAVALNVKGVSGWRYSMLRKARNWSLRAAHANVVLGERMLSRVAIETDNTSAIHIIHNWADGRGIIPVVAMDNPLRHDWELTDKFVVGYSGNMGRAHSFDTILEIAEKLKFHDDIVFLFIGGGAQRKRLEEQIASKELNNFLFKDYQPRENLTQSLGVPDVHLVSLIPDLEGLIVPSKFYGIAAAGRPVLFIGDALGEIAGLVRRLRCGAAITPGDTGSGVEYILRLRSSRDALAREGENARRAFLQEFTKDSACLRWKGMLGKVGDC